MDGLLHKIQETNRKAAKLERLLLRLKQERDEFEKKVVELEKIIEGKDATIEELEEKYEMVKVAKSMTNGQNLEEVYAKIDDYIKEIDICLKNFGD